MRRYPRLILMVVLFISFLTSYGLSKEFKLAPDFKLQDIYQDICALSNYKDKQPVLLFFWTTWCPYCQKELRSLNQSYAGLAEDGLEVLAINVGELPDLVENFTKSYYLAYRVLLDKDTSVAGSYGILGVPIYVIVDKNGYIVFQDSYFPYRGYKDLISDDKTQNPSPAQAGQAE